MGTRTLEVPARSDVSSSFALLEANSISQLSERARTGALGWAGPAIQLVGRSVLIIAAQAVTSCVLWLRSRSWSWNAAAKWWTVYATLVDIGCLALMTVYTRKERIRLHDLIGRIHLRWGRDILFGIAILILVFPFFILGAASASGHVRCRPAALVRGTGGLTSAAYVGCHL